MALKVLAVGSVLGEIRDFVTKVSAIDAKHGKFKLLLCVGDFFGQPGSRTDELDQLLQGAIQIPIPAYITQGIHPIPDSVLERANASGGTICPNLTLLGKSTIIQVPDGPTLGCLGGVYHQENFLSSDGQSCANNRLTGENLSSFLTSQQARQILQTSPFIDILITYQWPDAIVNHSSTPSSTVPQAAYIPGVLEHILTTTKPRYHFAAVPSKFLERETFAWDDTEENGLVRLTRFINLASFGDAGVENTTPKPRWFYAFNMSSSTEKQPKPKNATKNPYIVKPEPNPAQHFGTKRGFDDIGQNYIWGKVEAPSKRARNDGAEVHGETGCRKCQSTEHTIADCPSREKPPDGYVCRRCNEPGHYVRDCPQVGDTGGKKPKAGYVCRACGGEGHFVQDCRMSRMGGTNQDPQYAAYKRRKQRGHVEIKPDECWFCLSNERVAKHLLVSIGTEIYITLPKGQLHPTREADLATFHQTQLIPGGGHVLIVPIEHHSTLHALPRDVRVPIQQEIEQAKNALGQCYRANGACLVAFEMARVSGKGGHAHVQVVPVPVALENQVEEYFRREPGVKWEEDPEAALSEAENSKASYFRVDLPDGRKLVHIIDGYFELQFGRIVLAKLLGMTQRSDWRICALTEDEETRDVQAFKQVFQAYDPTT